MVEQITLVGTTAHEDMGERGEKTHPPVIGSADRGMLFSGLYFQSDIIISLKEMSGKSSPWESQEVFWGSRRKFLSPSERLEIRLCGHLLWQVWDL